MLQQTQVRTVIPYFIRWMKRFPTVKTLAAASEREVLKMWEGLGYYRRARLLREAARQIVTRHKGRFPRSIEAMNALPGVGRYTLGALASIAFDQPLPALDGNVIRVLCRRFGIADDTHRPATRKQLWNLARDLIPGAHGRDRPETGNLKPEIPAPGAGDFNQALMELGALVCIPHNPLCLVCPVREGCWAFAHTRQHELPRRGPPPAVIRQHEYAGLVLRNRRILLCQRRGGQRMEKLWQFPSVTLAEPSTRWLERWCEAFGKCRDSQWLAGLSYSVTNHRIRLELHRIQGHGALSFPGARWMDPATARRQAFTAAHRKLADRFLT